MEYSNSAQNPDDVFEKTAVVLCNVHKTRDDKQMLYLKAECSADKIRRK